MDKASILDMAHGAIKERVDYAMGEIIQNILDPNTDPAKTRKLTVELTFSPSSTRDYIPFTSVVKTKLQPTTAIQTSLSLHSDYTGKSKFVENTPQIPGQFNLEGDEQPQPKELAYTPIRAV